MDDSLAILLETLNYRVSHDPHDDHVRLAVRLRGRNACEYCLLPTEGGFHIDHIVPPNLWAAYRSGKLTQRSADTDRNGPQHIDNFAWSCSFCNERKGQQIGGRISRQSYRLFDPRIDHWPRHFVFVNQYLQIVGLTPIGQVTVKALGFNRAEPLSGQLAIRHLRHLRGQYPPAWASDWCDPFE